MIEESGYSGRWGFDSPRSMAQCPWNSFSSWVKRRKINKGSKGENQAFVDRGGRPQLVVGTNVNEFM
jgi:hypothetical protein